MVASAPRNWATMRPSWMTPTRSARARISSRLEEISSTATPWSRTSTSSCQTNWVAPMSRPRVGRAPPGERLALLLAEDRVLGDQHLQDHAAGVAVLGDVGDAMLAPGAHVGPGQLVVVQVDPAGVGRDQPDQGLDQLGLAVALDPGQPVDLRAAHVQVEPGHQLLACDRDPEVLDLEHGFPWAGLALDPAQQHRAADHH